MRKDNFNPFLVCGPKPKKLTKSQQKRLFGKLKAIKINGSYIAQRLDVRDFEHDNDRLNND